MKMLFVKLLRDIKHSLGQYISILLVLAVGCYFFAGMLEATTSIEVQIQNFYDTQNFADATGTFMLANEKAVQQVAAKPGVKSAAGRYTVNTKASIHKTGKSDVTVVTDTPGINIPVITDGAGLSESGVTNGVKECLIDMTFAKSQSMEIGQTISFYTPKIKAIRLTFEGAPSLETITDYQIDYTAEGEDGEQAEQFVVVGFFHSPEYVYKFSANDMAASASDFGAVLVRDGAISMLADSVGIYVNDTKMTSIDTSALTTKLYNQIVADAPGADLNTLFADLNGSSLSGTGILHVTDLINSEAVGVYLSALSYLQKDHPSELAFRNTFTQIKNLVFIFPFIFFIVAAIITFISLSKTVENQRTQIGVMQAMGVQKGNIYFTYLCYAMSAAVIGSLFGGILGIFTLPYIYHWVFNIQFIMPLGGMTITPLYVFVGLAVAVAVSLAAAFISCHRTLREIPAQALRPKPPKKTRRILLEKWTWFWKRTGFGAKMILRNIYLHKTRILLSSIGVIGCTALLMAGLGLKSRISYIIANYNNSINFDLQISSNESFGVNETDRFLSLDSNLKEVTFVPVASVKIEHNGKVSESIQAQAMPAGATVMKLFADKNGKQQVAVTDTTFALPHYLAEQLGVSVGDTVQVITPTGTSRKATVTDITYQYISAAVYASYEVYAGTLGMELTANTIYATLHDPSAASVTQHNLVDREDELIKSVYTPRSIQANIQKMTTVLDAAVMIIVIGAAVLAITVIYNITSINIFERTREIATLMVLGYKKHETNRLIIVENMVITAIGCLIGWPLGYGLFQWMVSIVTSMNITMPGNLTPAVILLSFALSFVFSLLATLILNRRMQKIDMVEALKSVE